MTKMSKSLASISYINPLPKLNTQILLELILVLKHQIFQKNYPLNNLLLKREGMLSFEKNYISPLQDIPYY